MGYRSGNVSADDSWNHQEDAEDTCKRNCKGRKNKKRIFQLKKISKDVYELGVHIADVSHYVKKDETIDKDAYERGTSVYLVDRVIPMLPHKLSNGICSLNPEVDRLALSCIMNINSKGYVIKYKICQSVIRSRKQMTYTCVNDILENNQVPSGYEPFVNDLKLMNELSNILINMGIPKKEIAYIHDANSEKERLDLYDKVRQGLIRVLIGSTLVIIILYV